MASDPEASADTKSTAIGGRGVGSKLIKISNFRPHELRLEAEAEDTEVRLVRAPL